MSKSIEQQAADAAQGVLNNLLTVHNAGQTAADAIAIALSRAGLLVSERDVLCREYADAHRAYLEDSRKGPRFGAAATALRAYDREHATKPRYTCDDKYVRDSVKGVIVGYGSTLAENAAMAAALNALAEKEAGR